MRDWDQLQIRDVCVLRRALIVALFPIVLVGYAVIGFCRGIAACIEEVTDLW